MYIIHVYVCIYVYTLSILFVFTHEVTFERLFAPGAVICDYVCVFQCTVLDSYIMPLLTGPGGFMCMAMDVHLRLFPA